MGLPETVYHIEGLKQCLWHRHGSVDAPAAFLERLENNNLVIDIDAAGCEGQSLREAAPGVIQYTAQGPYGPIGLCGGGKKGVTLVCGEVTDFA